MELKNKKKVVVLDTQILVGKSFRALRKTSEL
jgi:hypothetical protein